MTANQLENDNKVKNMELRMRVANEELYCYKEYTNENIKQISSNLDKALSKRFDLYESHIYQLETQLREINDQLNKERKANSNKNESTQIEKDFELLKEGYEL